MLRTIDKYTQHLLSLLVLVDFDIKAEHPKRPSQIFHIILRAMTWRGSHWRLWQEEAVTDDSQLSTTLVTHVVTVVLVLQVTTAHSSANNSFSALTH